ncbi:MAG: galactitol-1-phosphate 5-dehydrogenase [Verrucomicrobia bacterium]|nr:galactitol-1-phosphate 5-dehydrogenase [Verrucomicrobiota bacterium]
MKALELVEYEKFEYKEVPLPEIAPNEVLVRVAACGICGSDVHGMDGSSGRRIPPIIMGHEAAGSIAKLGAGVDQSAWKEGDRVTFDSTVYCGTCWHCRRGEVNLCDNRMVLGVSCGDYRRHGAFADFVAVPEHILYALPDSISFEQAAMVEAVSVAVHAVERTPVSLNDSVVIVGAGMIGLLCLQTIKAAGCGKTFVVDLDESRLALAKSFGADFCLDPSNVDVVETVQAETSGRGADISMEAVGISASTQTAIASLRKGGSCTLVGNLAKTVEMPLQEVVTRQISLIGTCASAGEYPACLDLIASGTIKVDPLISQTRPLEEGSEWFARLHKGEPGLTKVILKP